MFRGPFFESQDKIFLLGEAIECGVIFKKICIKIIKNMKITEKILEQMQVFIEKFHFLCAVGKNKNYYIHRL